jgi:hypothetical protein
LFSSFLFTNAQLPAQPHEVRIEKAIRGILAFCSRNRHDIITRLKFLFIQPVDFSVPAPDAVSDHGGPDFCADRYTEPVGRHAELIGRHAESIDRPLVFPTINHRIL